MKQFNELLERVEKLEEVVLELQQRMGMLEQGEARQVYLSPDAQRRLRTGRRRREAKREDS
ncbi:MAG: hypothetical protein H8E90_01485 [Anaerolineales bacterium]|nr:hypothetical protein [Anaerolineales bacterium]